MRLLVRLLFILTHEKKNVYEKFFTFKINHMTGPISGNSTHPTNLPMIELQKISKKKLYYRIKWNLLTSPSINFSSIKTRIKQVIKKKSRTNLFKIQIKHSTTQMHKLLTPSVRYLLYIELFCCVHWNQLHRHGSYQAVAKSAPVYASWCI